MMSVHLVTPIDYELPTTLFTNVIPEPTMYMKSVFNKDDIKTNIQNKEKFHIDIFYPF